MRVKNWRTRANDLIHRRVRTLPAIRSTLLPARAMEPAASQRSTREELVVVGHFALRKTRDAASHEHDADAWVQVPTSPRLHGMRAAPPVEASPPQAATGWEHRAMTPLPTEGYLALHAATLPLRAASDDSGRMPSRVDSVAARRGYGRIARHERDDHGLAASF